MGKQYMNLKTKKQKNKFYRLYDRQCQRYMATGYNAKSEADLVEAYWSYKSCDWEDDETENYYRGLSINEAINFIKDDEFEIEISNNKFEDYDY